MQRLKKLHVSSFVYSTIAVTCCGAFAFPSSSAHKPDLLSKCNATLAEILISDRTTCLWAVIPLTGRILRLKSLLTIAPNSQSLNRMLFKFQQISLMLASLLKVTQPLRSHLRSGCGSASASLKKPSYREQIASTSCRVMVGAKLRKNIEVVLWRDFGLSGFGVSSGMVWMSSFEEASGSVVVAVVVSGFPWVSESLFGWFSGLGCCLEGSSVSFSESLLLDEDEEELLPE